MKIIKFKLKNLTCEACIKLSESMIGEIEGVKKVTVKDLGGETEVEAERDISLQEIQNSLEGTNYEIKKE